MLTQTVPIEGKRGSKFKKFLEKQAAKGIRMEQIAVDLGCSHSTIMAWKYGFREPKGTAKKLIASVYGAEAI